ncbi:MFS transporter [Janthinobacterium fluminis]|uniref:MFS transporter n=1 Tax=Janthinobacterium fluminis TaxID=2987524 RepID=A0ABT5JYY6_9BURK|nr:MFS transporter [Janthinobacterium fluminis]MDC8757942.1 MFS transporter [Janthinobacterium fluminis]
MLLSVVMYKNIGISNTDIALYTSWLYLPWVIKPLWSPFVELFRTKRFWIVTLQLLIGAALAAVALTLPLPNFFQLSLAVLWLMAFSSATHDIAADGFYMLGLEEHQQAAFVGVRSTFYKLAMIAGQGGLVSLAGWLTESSGDVRHAWSVVFVLLALGFVGLALYHRLTLPRPPADRPAARGGRLLADVLATFSTFFKKDGILVILGFLLLFRFGEAQLLKLVVPFLLDPPAKGGLGLSTTQIGFVYGTLGVCMLVLGGLLGGYAISRFGLKRCLWPMVVAVHLPDLVFVYLATAMPDNIYVIAAGIAIEQFGYGFGFASYLLYMMMIADGPHKTAHYAICTGFMALGMMLPGMVSGWIQQQLGYQHFFIWVCIATLPAFAMTALVRIDPEFGKK